uniref:C-type lectin domain-containing protein n=2 Tax=Oryzias melastigma TaxID=30732 RepID=A0A3B3CKH3_ORYME
METNKQKQNLNELDEKNEQLNLENILLQNKTKDLMMNVTKLEDQTKRLTAEKKFFEIQNKEMTVNMTILQKQIKQLRNNSEAIIKYTNFPGDVFCPEGVCQTCPKDWIQFKESCYFIYNLNSPWKSWNESQQFCQMKKSDLVVINNREEQTFIKSRIEYYHDIHHGYWIGLRRINNNWIWVDESQDTLGYWKNPGSSEKFAIIVHDANLTHSWAKNRNGFENRFICEIKALIF